MRDYIGNLLMTQFPNLTKTQIVAFVQGLFNVNMDPIAFKQHLRDFLIALKEVTPLYNFLFLNIYIYIHLLFYSLYLLVCH